MTLRRWARKIVAAVSLAVTFFASGAFLFAQVAQAQSTSAAATQAAAGAATGACPGLVPCVPLGTFRALQTANKEIVEPTTGVILWGLLYNAISYVGNRLAYDSAMYLATGDTGQAPLFFSNDRKKEILNFGLDTVGDSIGLLDDILPDAFGAKFSLCRPENPVSNFIIAAGIKSAYSRPKPRCDLSNLPKDWEAFTAGLAQLKKDPTGEAMKALAGHFRPGANELSVGIDLNIKITEEVSLKRHVGENLITTGGGFKDVTDAITGQVKTPAAFVMETSKKPIIDKDNKQQEVLVGTLNNPSLGQFGASFGLQVVSVFFNTILSNGILSKIYNGLFPTTPPIDPFNNQLAFDNKGAAAAQFSSLLAVSPINIASYDALGEFSICPSGVVNRNVNNCVMDPSFVTAVSRGASGQALTVREAVQGSDHLLHGEWPLISQNDPAKNQDPFCYTSGYCYGNLVKLRKARIIPVGWEIAASLSRAEKPYTLNEVMNAFNDCKGNPTICHLIDPDWVLKYPESQCRASVNGELLAAQNSSTRNTYCADVTSCVSERNDGSCAAFGYCVREKNAWKFKGDACPAPFASCLTFTNKTNNAPSSFLLNTVNYAGCTEQNAGCRWYASQKALDNKGTTSTADDTNEWTGAVTERAYFNGKVQQCSAADAGCTKLIPSAGLVLNMVQNPGFEDDKNGDAVPDGWSWNGQPGTYTNDSAEGFLGSSHSIVPSGKLTQSNIELAPNAFYTFSVYTKGISEVNGHATLALTKEDGSSPDLTGTAFSHATCARSGATYSILAKTGSLTDYTRSSCSFTTGGDKLFANIQLIKNNLRFDAVQLESGEIATPFVNGYSSASAQATYVKIAPAYLKCTGSAADLPACAPYAQSCQAQDIGCAFYQPVNGDPAIPATITDADQCPEACVGYASFKQEKTLYEPSIYVSFIPKRATSCQATDIGCDSFTNLDAVSRGGEGVEYYTNLRVCSTPADAGANDATYFTWKGSDTAGYQLMTWRLLKSSQGAAPCTQWHMVNTGTAAAPRPTVQCTDTPGITAPADCKTHDDIIGHPDCREFYDTAGVIHYRHFSETITVSDECKPYRKTASSDKACTATGGLWIGSGECRYAGMGKESISCPASANGCRAYTGGGSRNLRTVQSEDFEHTNPATLPPVMGGATISLSSESLATAGHSLLVKAPAGAGIKIDLGDIDRSKKTVSMEFWAKGSNAVSLALVDRNNGMHDLVNVSNATAALTPLQLTTDWRSYTVGPLDTSTFPVLTGSAKASAYILAATPGTFFLDNILIKQAEDSIAVIENSWTVPVSCDTAPNGAAAPQYYLGCQAYTDKKADTKSLYQFTRLCSEKVVGCQAFYDTRNSASPSGKIFNALCQSDAPAVGALACKPSATGPVYCTIAAGHTSCLFDYEGNALPPNIQNSGFTLSLGKEARLVRNDAPTYLVDTGANSCAASAMGCREFGAPKFAQDQKTVASYSSVYLLDTPEAYRDILCADEALFCDAWSTPKDGTYFFKNPLDKQCEFKPNVRLGSGTYDGWFRKGTNTPCYQNNIVAGRQYGIWKNGDAGTYDGWVGACTPQDNRCTEFVDPTDVTTAPRGASYFFINNDTLEKSTGQGLSACEGRAGQKAGCALFNSGNIIDLPFAAAPSYILSTHADVLTSQGPADVAVDPVDCRTADGGVRTYKKPDETKVEVDLCSMRCRYDVGRGERLLVGRQLSIVADPTAAYLESCLADADCAIVKGSDATSHQGHCVDVRGPSLSSRGVASTSADFSGALRYVNDTNRVLRVQRDRACAQWLTCSSARASWNSQTNKYMQICDKVDLCTQAGSGDRIAQCAEFGRSQADILSPKAYQARDTSWNGLEYAGLSIPNQLPVDLYEDVKVSFKDAAQHRITMNTMGYVAGSCPSGREEDEGANCRIGICSDAKGSCTSGADCNPGATCTIGFCQKQASPRDINPQRGSFCFTDTECGAATPFCEPILHVCVDHVDLSAGTNCTSDTACSDAGPTRTNFCRYLEGTKIGSCFNGQCITSVRDADGNGVADQPTLNTLVPQACRAYPESDAPFPARIVRSWINSTNPNSASTPVAKPETENDKPKEFIAGYASVNTYAPVKTASEIIAYGLNKNPDPLKDPTLGLACDYEKVTFGSGGATRYYKTGERDKGFVAVCVGGAKDGMDCSASTVDCGTGGTCQHLSKLENLIGWSGYCLEHDSSIQLFGSQSDKDRPCLSWLPVDQLFSSSDLYGKFATAGAPAEDRYYCAETALYYDVYTTSGFACAETASGFCNDDTQTVDGKVYYKSKIDWFTDNSCWKDVACPPNYFAIISGCVDFAPKRNDKLLCAAAESDCPYFCVPTLSVHSAEGGNKGKGCVPPDPTIPNEDGVVPPSQAVAQAKVTKDNLIEFQGQSWITDHFPNHLSGWDTNVYLAPLELGGKPFENLKTFYDDCVASGVPAEKSPAEENLVYEPGGHMPSRNVPPTGTFSDTGYRDLYMHEVPYLGCRSIAQVGSASLRSSLAGSKVPGSIQVYNQAWTDRVWLNKKAGQGRYIIQSPTGGADPHFGFGASIPRELFGSAQDPQISIGPDNRPQAPAMCGKILSSTGQTVGPEGDMIPPEIDGTCPEGYGFIYGKTRDAQEAYELYNATVSCQARPDLVATCWLDYFAKEPQTQKICPQGVIAVPRLFKCQESEAAIQQIPVAALAMNGCDGKNETPQTPAYMPGAANADFSFIRLHRPNGGAQFCRVKYTRRKENDPVPVSLTSDCNTLSAQLCIDVVDEFPNNSGQNTKRTFCNPEFGYPGTPQIGEDMHPEPANSCTNQDTVIPKQQDLEQSSLGASRLKQIFGSAVDIFRWYPLCFNGKDTPDACKGSIIDYDAKQAWKNYFDAKRAHNDWPLLGSYIPLSAGSADNIVKGSPAYADFSRTITLTGDGEVKPLPPIIRPVGNCQDGICFEDDPTRIDHPNPTKNNNQFTLNKAVYEPIIGADGSVHANMSFFAFANDNQGPLRKIIVDWGDSHKIASPLPVDAWPNDSSTQAPSNAPNNFYQNHRGLDENGAKICGNSDKYGNFGQSIQACDPSYIEFSKDYICTKGMVGVDGTLSKRACKFGDRGQLLNSPCTGGAQGPDGAVGKCVFQPRVFVMDNWGWCSGTCTQADGHTLGACYGDQCLPDQCPTTSPNDSVCQKARDGKIDDPWVYYSKYVIVAPPGTK